MTAKTTVQATEIAVGDHVFYECGNHTLAAVAESVRRTESYGQDVMVVTTHSERYGCDVTMEVPANAKVTVWNR